MSERRYFIDHGVIHDRLSGKHVEIEEAVDRLNDPATASTAGERIAWGVVTRIGPLLTAAEDELRTHRSRMTALAAIRDRVLGAVMRQFWYAPEIRDVLTAIDSELSALGVGRAK